MAIGCRITTLKNTYTEYSMDISLNPLSIMQSITYGINLSVKYTDAFYAAEQAVQGDSGSDFIEAETANGRSVKRRVEEARMYWLIPRVYAKQGQYFLIRIFWKALYIVENDRVSGP